MPLYLKVQSAYHRAMAYLARLFGSEPAELTVPFIPDITRYFLGEAIADRVRCLADGAANQEESFRDEVNREYCARVEEALRRELKAQSKRWTRFDDVEKDLGNIKLPRQFSDDVFANQECVIGFLRVRTMFFPGRFGSYEALVVAGIFLRAIQQVALDIIRIDYPAAGPDTDNVEAVVRRILARLDKLQRLLQTPVELKSLAKAETELRVLVARTRGVACLPLRSIPTSPLPMDDEKHYVGRPDEQSLRLARQIRHADGTILVTGYRGVGKSSFVNRVVYHALEAQKEVPSDGWLIVPVTVNLAKVAGVQNILRLTLRAVREALLEPNSRKPRTVPRHSKLIPLPLSKENEIEPLEEAYIRATYKVTMSQSAGSEKRWDLGSSMSIDPGTLLGGKILGMELGKFLEAGIKKTKTEKINRELSLLDFDENAAEESLARLIRSVAAPRPLIKNGPSVRIKLVFIFDELDKMDIDLGLKPMIEGLKNLFLQQYSVFVLVTSKKFYYDLLKDRAIEDAMLNSYFSAIVHVPLLSFAEARKMVDDWVDWNATEQLKTPAPAESKLIDQLTRVLVYRSFGNPRDIIRELRLMQDWAETADQPYLTDRLSKSPSLQIFAVIQDCIEKTAVPQQATSTLGGPDGDGSVALVSERLVGDEARLEQVRRGLYILTEELINRQTLSLEPSGADEPVSPLQEIQRDNFSLLSLADVQQLARRLGRYLSLMHDSPDLFLTSDWGARTPLFELGPRELRVTNEFYALTGRQAVTPTSDGAAVPTQTKTPEVLIEEAENFAGQAGWAAKLAAINIIKQLRSDKLSAVLKNFLWEVAETDPEPAHRVAAAERLPQKTESPEDINRIAERLKNETDERVLSIFIGLLSGASGAETRKTATDAIVGLLQADASSRPARKLSDSTAIAALTVLQTVANRDVTSEVLQWLSGAGDTELVQTTAISVLKKNSEQFGADVADKIISNDQVLKAFTRHPLDFAFSSFRQDNVKKAYLRELLQANPLAYASKLLNVSAGIYVDDLVTFVLDLAFTANSQETATFILEQLLGSNLMTPLRLHPSLRNMTEFQGRVLPYLRRQLPESVEQKRFTADQGKSIEAALATLETMPAPSPPLPKVNPGFNAALADLLKRTAPTNSSAFDEPWNPSRTYGLLAVGILLFLPGFFFYKWDLPAEASFGTVVASRFLLLVLDALIMYPFLTAIASAQATVRRETVSPLPNALYGALVPIAYAIYYTHTKYIGPLHFGAQALQFVINWPALMALFMAFRIYKP